MGRKIEVIIPETEEELKGGMEVMRASFDAANLLQKTIEAKLDFLAKDLSVGDTVELKIGSYKVLVIRAKSGQMRLCDPESRVPFSACKTMVKLNAVKYLSEVLEALQNPAVIQGIFLYLYSSSRD